MAFNWSKIKEEIGEYVVAWKNGDDTATHVGGEWVNRFVEGARASPYTSGRIDAFLWPLVVIEAVVIFILWRLL